jgi:Zn-dependent protease
MLTDIEIITPLVSQVLLIDDITRGDEQNGFLVRYRGSLRVDSIEAYAQLDEKLTPYNLTPLFRERDNQHHVIIHEGRVSVRPSNPWINLIMFTITLISVIFTGAASVYQPPPGADLPELFLGILQNLSAGLPFALSLMGILLAHEFGHYLVGRFHRAPVTLPYFIPLPFPVSPFGTMGAVIQMKAPPRDRRSLLEIGIAGPLAGLVVAVPILIYGLSLSQISILEPVENSVLQMEGNSILYLFLKWLVFQQVLPSPVNFGDQSPLLYWVTYFFTGKPFPWGGVDVMIHPVAFAGWAGLLVTALNLIPVGQLDGGHILYSLFGKQASRAFPFLLAAVFLLGFVWSGWWLWAVLLLIFGRVYDEPLDQITTLDPRRKILAFVGLALFFLVFSPVPLIFVSS